MKSGCLSESVSFEDKERLVRARYNPILYRLDILQNRDQKGYESFIETSYKKHQSLTSFWEEYVDEHGTPEQINRLLALKDQDEEKYHLKLQHVYRGLINHADEA